MERISIRGLCLDKVTKKQALDFAFECLERKKLCRVYTPGTELAWRCLKDKDTLETVNRAELLLADGVGVVYASRIMGEPLPQKVAGVEFGEELIALCSEKKAPFRFFLLGAAEGVAEEAVKKLSEKYENAVFCGSYHGYFKKDGKESEDVCRIIRESGADAVYVCFGQPVQEKWIEKYADLCGASVFAALGGSLDVFSGKVERAPAFFVKTGLEWFYRLIKEPKRFKRMLCLPAYLFSTLFYRIFKGKSC